MKASHRLGQRPVRLRADLVEGEEGDVAVERSILDPLGGGGAARLLEVLDEAEALLALEVG